MKIYFVKDDDGFNNYIYKRGVEYNSDSDTWDARVVTDHFRTKKELITAVLARRVITHVWENSGFDETEFEEFTKRNIDNILIRIKDKKMIYALKNTVAKGTYIYPDEIYYFKRMKRSGRLVCIDIDYEDGEYKMITDIGDIILETLNDVKLLASI